MNLTLERKHNSWREVTFRMLARLVFRGWTWTEDTHGRRCLRSRSGTIYLFSERPPSLIRHWANETED